MRVSGVQSVASQEAQCLRRCRGPAPFRGWVGRSYKPTIRAQAKDAGAVADTPAAPKQGKQQQKQGKQVC